MALDIKFRFTNLEQKMKALSVVPQGAIQRMKLTTNNFLLDVLRDSKTVPPRVPVDTGALQSSGGVDPAKVNGLKIQADIHYGGISGPPFNKEVDYAVVVHEDVSRKFRRPGAGPKFVSTHLEKKKPAYETELINDLDNTAKKV